MTDTALSLAEPLTAEGVLNRIDSRYRRKLIERTHKMDRYNAFWTRVIAPNIWVPDLDQHIALHRTPECPFSHMNSLNAHYAQNAGTLDQTFYPLFSNIMRKPAFGPGYRRYQDQWRAKWERPIHRGAVGQFWTFTFEWDTEEIDGLQKQLDWVWHKDSNRQTEIEKLHRFFRSQFKDYRGYCVIWSGGKSVHINFIFDTSHMSKAAIETIAERDGKSPEAKLRDYWQGDINPAMIWDYYTSSWNRLNAIILEESSISANFDSALSTLFQKRRTPWGIRIAGENDANGFRPGDRIPQVVLDEAILRTSPKSASTMFLSSIEANALPITKGRSAKAAHSGVILAEPNLLDKLIDYLAHTWGNPYPKPAEIFEDDHGIGVRFFNSEQDAKPSSIAYGEYASLRYMGRDAPSDRDIEYFPGKQTLNDLLCDLLDELGATRGAPAVPNFQTRPKLPWDNTFAKCAMTQTPGGIRSGMSQGTSQLTQASSLAVIVSAEGAGKSTALIRQAGHYRLEDQIESFFKNDKLIRPHHGHQIVSCKSYQQAEEQYEAYQKWRGEVCKNSSQLPPPAPLFIRSFAELYRKYCVENDIDRIGHLSALTMGFDSQVEAVMKCQPTVFAAVSLLRDKAWTYEDAKGNIKNGFEHDTSVLVFTVHDMAQSYNSISKSKAWLNPTFTSSAFSDPAAWASLASEFKAYRIIHDELALADLLHIAHENEVGLADTFKAMVLSNCNDAWSDIKKSERLKLFDALAFEDMREIGFYRINELADLNFGVDDVVHIDYDAFPFGESNKSDALYRRTHGRRVYVRSRDWWIRLKARVVFTTTETLPASVASAIFSKSSPRRGRVVGWDDDAYFLADPVQLKMDNRANKEHIDELVADILNQPPGQIDQVISDMASGSRVVSHSSARGRNNMNGMNLATTLTFIGEIEFMELNVIAQKYGITSVFKTVYLDRYNQAVGRNRGLRGNASSPLKQDVYISPRLLRMLGGAATFQQGRYPAFLVP